MKILVLGGTQFIGRHVVGQLLLAGHSVTLLNRGRTGPGLFPELARIVADRETADFARIPELKQDWDAVIDLSAYFPGSLDRLLKTLAGKAGRYVFCSTISVYATASFTGSAGPTPILREDGPLHPCTEAEALDPSNATYGRRKAECERVVMRHFDAGLPTVILRPSVVYGAQDYTDRTAYWIWRAAGKEPFILPDDGLTITRRTYAPDLAAAFVSALTAPKASGQAYNVAEFDTPGLRDSLQGLGIHLGTRPLDRAVSVSSEILLKEGIRPWADLPLWLPRTHLLIDTFRSRMDLALAGTPASQALAAAADAFLSEGREPTSGLSPAAEAELLKRLRHSA